MLVGTLAGLGAHTLGITIRPVPLASLVVSTYDAEVVF